VETGVRRRCKADGVNVKRERGRVVGFFHDGGLRVKAQGGREDENGPEQTDMSLNGTEHERWTPCGDDTDKRTAWFPRQELSLPTSAFSMSRSLVSRVLCFFLHRFFAFVVVHSFVALHRVSIRTLDELS
jgi:hypothetical protein